jgi:hypothetical protein
MTIRPGLGERLAWMAENVYATYRCGLCVNSGWCDSCKERTLRDNGGRLPSKWNAGDRAALEEFIARSNTAAVGKETP